MSKSEPQETKPKTQIKVSEATLDEFQQFTPTKKERKVKPSWIREVVGKVVNEGKTLKAEGLSKGQVLALMAYINRVNEKELVYLNKKIIYKADMNTGVIYMTLMDKGGG